MQAVAEEANVPDRFRPVVRLGVDETVSRRRRRFGAHLVDLDTGTVIATVEGRGANGLLQALAAQGEEWLARVEQVALDPFTPYAKAHPARVVGAGRSTCCGGPGWFCSSGSSSSPTSPTKEALVVVQLSALARHADQLNEEVRDDSTSTAYPTRAPPDIPTINLLLT